MIDLNFFQLGPIPPDALTGRYDMYLVVLSYVIAIFASYVAFDIASTLRQQKGKWEFIWLIFGAFSMGAGIFSMHFIGMLAYSLPIQEDYSFILTLTSLIVPIIASGLALKLITPKTIGDKRLIIGGIIFGLAIASMHYIGMAAMVGVHIHYLPGLFFLSIAIAIGASIAALWMMLRGDTITSLSYVPRHALSAFIMGTSIIGMHYTGMYAAVFTPKEAPEFGGIFQYISFEQISFLVAFIVSLILIVTLAINSTRHSIVVKLVLGYIVITLMLIPLSFISIENVKIISQSFERVTGYSFPKIQASLEMKNIINQAQLLVTELDYPTNENELTKVKFELLALMAELDKWKTRYEQALDIGGIPHPSILGKLKTLKDNVILAAFTLIEAKEQGLSKEQDIIKKTLVSAEKELAQFLEAIIAQDLNERNKLQDNIQLIVTEAFNLSLLMMGVVLIFSLLISIFLALQISTPLLELKASAEEIAKEQKIKKIPITSNDEIGELENSFNIMVDALAEAKAKRDEFMSMAAHDLRNPLNVIIAGNTLLLSSIEKQDKVTQEKILNMVNNASISMLSLLDELLVVNSIQTAGFQIKQKKVNLKAFAHEIFEFNSLLANYKHIKFNLDTEIEKETVVFDKDKVIQVVNNFLSNAFKFSQPQSIVLLSIKQKMNLLRIEVKDEAGGIPKEEQNKIFTTFAKISTKPTAGEATHGLGLAISKAIVQALGGNIGFTSIPGKGTTFFLEIDVKDVEKKPLVTKSSPVAS